MSLPRRSTKARGGAPPAYVGTSVEGVYEVPIPPSSNVSKAVYERETATLTISFRDGSIYTYLHVPDVVVRQLSQTDSAGRFVHRTLAAYTCKRA